MRFELEGGHWTEVVFVTIKGKVVSFPDENVELVRKEGTPEAKKILKEKLGEET